MKHFNHNSAASPAESAWTALESLPGVDSSLALDLLDDDRDMFTILAEFTQDFGGLLDETNAIPANGDHETLIRRMHAHKGAAATLGLQALSSGAFAMEIALNKQQETSSASLEALRQSFSVLLPLLQSGRKESTSS
jgi:HPt (histidine-containing phosphotransfer) domain-containing protein